MKLLTLNFFLLIIYFISTTISSADSKPDLKNLTVHKETKQLKDIKFKNSENQIINIDSFKGKLIVINFWATWCAPCREEMPSLDLLQNNDILDNIIVLPINVGRENKQKALEFFLDLNIKNLKLFYDDSIELAKSFSLVGLPTTIFINKKGDEFARLIGSADFKDRKLIEWLANYN